MTSELASLVGAVDQAFAMRDPALATWPDPQAGGRESLPEEYSRITDAAKWRILGARVDAWVRVLLDRQLAAVHPIDLREITWAPLLPRLTSAVRVVPVAAGALPLIVARNASGDVPDAGIALGLGDPAECVGWFPHCGCDACDNGSEPVLDTLDEHLLAIVGGRYRRLTRGDRVIVDLAPTGWRASGEYDVGEVKRILADPSGWGIFHGAPWLA